MNDCTLSKYVNKQRHACGTNENKFKSKTEILGETYLLESGIKLIHYFQEKEQEQGYQNNKAVFFEVHTRILKCMFVDVVNKRHKNCSF